jgi:hypothetical protein
LKRAKLTLRAAINTPLAATTASSCGQTFRACVTCAAFSPSQRGKITELDNNKMNRGSTKDESFWYQPRSQAVIGARKVALRDVAETVQAPQWKSLSGMLQSLQPDSFNRCTESPAPLPQLASGGCSGQSGQHGESLLNLKPSMTALANGASEASSRPRAQAVRRVASTTSAAEVANNFRRPG